MATTTTINPTSNAFLWQGAENTNYGDTNFLRSGVRYAHGQDSCYNIVMEFNISAYTDPSAIIQADLTLTANSTTGTATSKISVHRLGITFTEADPDGCTWNDNGDASITWNGAEDYKEDNVTVQTYTVGSGQSDVTINLIDFMRDAITRRKPILRIGLYDDCVGTIGASAYTAFCSTRHATSANHPELEITVADRIYWTGALGNGNTSTSDNWSSDILPSINDFVMFTSGSEDCYTGSGILCHSLFIGSEYTGQIGLVDDLMDIASATTYLNPKRVINQNTGKFFINDVTSASVSTTIYISDAPTGSVYERTYGATAIVSGGELELIDLADTLIASRAKNSGTKIKLSGSASDIIASHCKLTLENGCGSGIFVDGTKVTCTDGTLEDATISGRSVVVYRGKLVDGTTTIYNGRLTFHQNENGKIVTEDILLYKGAVFDSRTGTGAWSPNATPSIDVRGGGNFTVDKGKTVALGT